MRLFQLIRIRQGIALALVGFCMAGCEDRLPGKPPLSEKPVPPDEVMDFHKLFDQNCAGCHGKQGNQGPAPPLNDSLFLGIVPDAELLKVVGQGRKGTPMPAFVRENGGPLTPEQVKVLASGLKKWKTGERAAESVPPYLAPAKAEGPTRGDGKAGAKVFFQACAGCHGDQGRGGSFGKQQIGAINDPAFLNLVSDQMLRRIIITGRTDLEDAGRELVGMPSFDRSTGRPAGFKPLTSQDITDLVALLAEWRKY